MKSQLIVTSLGLMIAIPAFAEIITLPELSLNQIESKQAAAVIQTKAPEIKQHVLQQLQNVSSETVKEAVKEPNQATFNIFPIETPLMSPGKTEARQIDLPQLPQPLFIIGSDELSKNWLKEHAAQLKKIKAIGFLIQAQNETDFEAVKNIADGLAIIPLSGDQLATQWNINHYPVLISRKAIEQ